MKIKFCKKCQVDTNRYINGSCQPCNKAYQVAYYSANTDKVKARNAVWWNANREKGRALTRAWNKSNPDLRRVAKHKRRSSVMNAEGAHTAVDIRNILTLQKLKCACCRTGIKNGYHVDHVIPLVSGGGNDKLNLQLLCPTCNLSKSARHPIDFMQSRGFLL